MVPRCTSAEKHAISILSSPSPPFTNKDVLLFLVQVPKIQLQIDKCAFYTSHSGLIRKESAFFMRATVNILFSVPSSPPHFLKNIGSVIAGHASAPSSPVFCLRLWHHKDVVRESVQACPIL